MDFYHHSAFEKELGKFVKKHCQDDTTPDMVIRHMNNLLTSHFEHQKQVFPSLRQANDFRGHEVYFHRLIVPGCHLSRTQYPKCYFYRRESFLSILCSGSHIDGYKDADLRDTALRRLSDIIEYINKYDE